jgi:hypothetical protein
MFKKLLAGLTTIVLSLGMVALTAGPASAHHNTISVSVACNTGAEGYWKVTWSVTNSEADKSETITSSTDTSLVPIGTVIAAGATATFIEYYSAIPSSDKTLTLGAQWSNGVTNSNNGKLKKNDFSSDCIPDDTDKKVDVCHYDSGQGGKYTLNDISVEAVLNGSGHAGHDNDIIPPFDYVDDGVNGHYDGKNWDAYGQWVYANGCSNEVTPTAPSFADAICTGPGTYGQGSYTIPATAGVIYQVGSSASGPWTTTSAGTHPVAVGTHVFLQAIAETGYILQGTTAWDGVIGSPSDCREPATASAGTFTDEVCNPTTTGTISGFYTVPSSAHVTYQVAVNGGAAVTAAAGDYPVSVGDEVTITPIADSGYTLTGDAGPWSHTFVSAGDCDDVATPVDPTVAPQTCVEDEEGNGSYVDGSITIAASTGVNYFIDGTPFGAGQHAFGPGTYTVTAEPQDGYQLEGYPDGGWSLTVTAAQACGQLDEHPPVKPTVAFTQLTCTANGSYTLGTEEGTPESVVWTVNGSPAADGTFVVSTAGTVTITAAPADGFGFDDPKQQTEWTFEFIAPSLCDLTTLALTGAPVAAGVVGLWGVLTVVGVLLILSRQRQEIVEGN